MVEHAAVNRVVVGSSPTFGANFTRLLEIQRLTAADPGFNQFILKSCLTTPDPLFAKRTWQKVMDQMQTHGKDSTKARCARAMQSKAFDGLRRIKLMETTAEDLLTILNWRQGVGHPLLETPSQSRPEPWLVPSVTPGALAAGFFDEDAAHGLGRGGEEMSAIGKLRTVISNQSQPGLMHQRGGLQSLVGRFVGHFRRRQFAQFPIDQRQQFIGGFGVAMFDGLKNAGHVAQPATVTRILRVRPDHSG
jgi:hypothetical protein